MGGVGHVSPDGAGDKVAVVLQNRNVWNEATVGKDGGVGEVQELSEEEESKMNEIVDLNKEEGGDAVPLGQKHQQQQVPGPIICWDRFLPVRTLKVLLVESDDSTRQVVSALLRNCSYEVTATANGLEAWKILEDLTNHTDLILTEVVMPCLSGIGLLSKIMNHKTRKNIPVIMMSSNDSMGTVFKCLSKGAVDFLVKPIRKNELKNLWQHVWRRCHSSSGSGSESGIQTQKSVKSKSVDSDNNSGSNDDDNGSTPLHARDGSDDGSGTQSSWTKRAVEIESPQRASPDQFADPPDSTCAQVIHPRPDASCNGWVAMSVNEDNAEHKEPADDFMGKDLEIGVARHANVQFEIHTGEKICSKVVNTNMDSLLGSDKKTDTVLGHEGKNVSNEQRPPAADLIGAIDSNSDLQPVARIIQVPNGYSRAPEGKEKAADGSTDVPSLELSLKRLRSISDGGTATTDDRNVLRRSEQSAFSRYHTSAASNQAPTGHGGSSPLENSSEAIRPESMYNTVFSSSADPIKQGSNGSSNNNEMGSTAKNIFAKPTTHKEKIVSPSAVKFSQTSSAFHPLQLQASTNQQVEKAEEKTLAAAKDANGVQHQVEVQHHHHHFHHHHVHVHNLQNQEEQEPLLDHIDLTLDNNTAGAAAQCGSSNAFFAPVEGNAANYRSNSGSNHGSNGHNGRNAAMKAGGTNVESASSLADRSGAGGGNGSGSGSASGVDQHRFAQREAALKKFRQKRKERNFGKKVRYQSRKRLAEQRPRVRGQFVRQNVQDQTGREKEKSAS